MINDITLNHGVRILGKDDIKRYVYGGRGIFILKSNKSEKMCKYKMSICKKNDDLLYISDWSKGYLGFVNIKTNTYTHSKKSKVSITEESVKGIAWLVNQFNNEKDFPVEMEFYHMGVCCCCGRTLTVRDNIELGIGPICFKNYGNRRMKKILKIKKVMLKKMSKN